MSKKVMLCAISNISSGNCSEDCSFCTQSAHNDSDIDKFKKKPVEQILKEASIAKQNKAVGFCLVTSGKGLDDRKLEFVTNVAKEVKKRTDIMLIACNGIASYEQLKELKKAGIDSYNHNIETSESFYKTICSTHDWHDRYKTCQDAKKAGLMLCAGGIFGLGESEEDRSEYIDSLRSLEPFSSPINFFIPSKSLKVDGEKITKQKGVEIIKKVKKALPSTKLMVAGGRELVFGEDLGSMFKAGAEAMVIGDYLTSKGDEPCRDLRILNNLGFEPQSSCHE